MFQFLRRLQKRFKKNKVEKFQLAHSEVGISFRHIATEEITSIPWNLISKITVFERDVYANDLICMLIEYGESKAVEFDEEMPGWDSVVRDLDKHLPGAIPNTDWFSQVAFPAFETKPTVVFAR